LNNLSVQQAKGGDRDAALASITDAVDVYRGLAGARPEVFLPALATSLNNLWGRQAEGGDRDAALAAVTAVIDTLPNAATRAELRGRAAAPFLARGDTASARALIVDGIAEAAAGAGNRLGAARRALRASALALTAGDHADLPDAPPWASAPLDSSAVDHVNGWLAAASRDDEPSWLRAHEVPPVGFEATLAILHDLSPGDPGLLHIRARLDQLSATSREDLAAELERDRTAMATIAGWIETPTWTASREFLQANREALQTQETRRRLAAQPQTPGLVQHRAILDLEQHLGLATTYQIVIDPEAGAAHIDESIGTARLDLVEWIVLAAPHLQQTGAGHIATAVLALMAGDEATAQRLTAIVAGNALPLRKEAIAIHLRNLGRTASILQPALLRLIDLLT
jgi:hypothetical protein